MSKVLTKFGCYIIWTELTKYVGLYLLDDLFTGCQGNLDGSFYYRRH